MIKNNSLDQKIIDMINTEEGMILIDKIDLEIIKGHIVTIVTKKYFVKKHTEIEMIVRKKFLIKETSFQGKKMIIDMIEGERGEVVRVKIIKLKKNQDFKMIELSIFNHVIKRNNLNQEDQKIINRLYLNQDKNQRFMTLNIGRAQFKNNFNKITNLKISLVYLKFNQN